MPLAPLSLYAITWIQVSMSYSTNLKCLGEHLYQLITSVRRVYQVYYTNSAFRAFQTLPTLHVE